MNAHWTERSTQDFVYRIASDFALQIENKMGEEPINQSNLAKRLGVSDGRVSQVLKSPGNLTIKKMVEYARAMGMKVAIVAYEDNDPSNKNGPINSQIFSECWSNAGKPKDFFTLRECSKILKNVRLSINYIERHRILSQSQNLASDIKQLFDLNWQDKQNTTSNAIQSGVQ
jgi:predicted XRE-type DNA-binding protein